MSRGAVVVAIWAVMNGVLAAVLFVFEARDEVMERAFYFASVGLLLIAALLILVAPHRRGRPSSLARSGVAAPAFAGACFFGGMAWVFGVYVAYFALPLLAVVVGRLWADRKESPLP